MDENIPEKNSKNLNFYEKNTYLMFLVPRSINVIDEINGLGEWYKDEIYFYTVFYRYLHNILLV